MAVIDFKSVGVSVETLVSSSLDVTPTPIGMVTPLRPGRVNGGIFEMYTSLRSTLNDNFKNLLMTDHGERLAIYDFGANLRELTFEMSAFNKEEFDSEAVIRIKTSANKYMPFLQLKTFESSVDHHDNSVVGKVVIRITYDIPRLNVQDQAQEVTLFVGG